MLDRMRISWALRKEKKLLTKDKLLVSHLFESNQILSKIVARGIPISWDTKLRTAVEFHVRRQLKEIEEIKRSLEEDSFLRLLQAENYLTPQIDQQFQKHLVKKSDLKKGDAPQHTEIEKLFRSRIDEIIKLLKIAIQRIEDQREEFTLEEMKHFLEQEKEMFSQLSQTIEAFAIDLKSTFTQFTLTRRGFFKAAAGVTALATDIIFDYKTWLGVLAVLKVAALRLPLKEKEGFAIIIGDVSPFTFIPGVEFLFKQAYISRMELAVGFRAKRVCPEGKINDLYTCLEDDTIQNIAVFGHGTRSSIRLMDGALSSDELSKKYVEIVKRKYNVKEGDQVGLCHAIDNNPKKGYLFKHSCGPGEKDFLGEWGRPAFPLDRIIQWKRVTGLYDLFFNPWGKNDKWVNHLGEFRAFIYKKYHV